MALTSRRFVNMVYYLIRSGLEHDEAKLREFEAQLRRGSNWDGSPSWWHGEDEAAAASMAVAAQLGVRPRTF